MKKVLFNILLCLIVVGFLICGSLTFQSCETGDVYPSDTCTICKDTIRRPAYKPNIYMYPPQNTSLKVTIFFPKGGTLITSVPSYNDGWIITVDATGRIDQTYDYLFYESNQPNDWQQTSGWIIEADSLGLFFQTNMAAYGFDSREIKDFTDYWVPRLNKYRYYRIYPQEKSIIDNLIQVNYSVNPDYILRLFYAIKGTNEKLNIQNHTVINNFKRDGFYVAEWGVIIE